MWLPIKDGSYALATVQIGASMAEHRVWRSEGYSSECSLVSRRAQRYPWCYLICTFWWLHLLMTLRNHKLRDATCPQSLQRKNLDFSHTLIMYKDRWSIFKCLTEMNLFKQSLNAYLLKFNSTLTDLWTVLGRIAINKQFM